ncbi:MAG TPA: ABC transporter ATP-binding protein [Rhizobiales bacterium]|nr:ABC transporter ATP-binding protein [Hyphomicrobiales bacterium]
MLKVDRINSYYGGAHILKDLSLQVKKHEVVALLGRNGAGKSTTMKSIMGLVPPVSGSISFEGQNISAMDTHLVCQQGIGYVPEDRRIFPDLTVEENLEVGKRSVRDGVTQWAHDDLFDLFPNLAERRNQLGGSLSGGEQQMLTIARTLMGNPSMILLDEPSEGIAPVIVEQLAGVIADLKAQGLAILLSEQNMHFARLVSTQTYIIEQGVIRYEGSFYDLDRKPDIWKKYLAV